MTELNPIAGAILGSAQAQFDSAIEKERQIRRRQVAGKVVGAEQEDADHQVESAEEVSPIHDQNPDHSQNQGGRSHHPPHGGDGFPHIDLTA